MWGIGVLYHDLIFFGHEMFPKNEKKKGQDSSVLKSAWNVQPPKKKRARDVDSYHFNKISECCIEFIDSLVRVEPTERTAMNNILGHSYFKVDLKKAPKLDRLYSVISKNESFTVSGLRNKGYPEIR